MDPKEETNSSLAQAVSWVGHRLAEDSQEVACMLKEKRDPTKARGKPLNIFVKITCLEDSSKTGKKHFSKTNTFCKKPKDTFHSLLPVASVV